jgi:hypothetical protein
MEAAFDGQGVLMLACNINISHRKTTSFRAEICPH